MAQPPSLDCGSCNLCCKLLAIPSIDKPARFWCPDALRPHGGCAVHGPNKPDACVSFKCVWLASQGRELAKRLPLELRPNRCHVVMGPQDPNNRKKLYVHVDPEFQTAWTKEPIAPYIDKLRRRGGTVEVVVGEDSVMLEPYV